MKVLVTGSSGHLGEALVRSLSEQGHAVVGLDRLPAPTTHAVCSIDAAGGVRRAMSGCEAVLHTATLHKPHVATHSRQAFVDTNITGTLTLLEAAVTAGVQRFVFTSTTSVFGAALSPPPGEPAAWITEAVTPVPKNIYGVTKTAAEDLCQLFQRLHGLPCVVLRTSRFFPEADDDATQRERYSDANLKANELLHRRVDLADVVLAHRLALERAPALGFDRFVISATTPFERGDMAALRGTAAQVLQERVPQAGEIYARLGWALPQDIDRVYVNERARTVLGWQPEHGFEKVLQRLAAGEDPRSALARSIGSKGYHPEVFDAGPSPV